MGRGCWYWISCSLDSSSRDDIKNQKSLSWPSRGINMYCIYISTLTANHFMFSIRLLGYDLVGLSWVWNIQSLYQLIFIHIIFLRYHNQSTVSTAKRLSSLFWYLIASTIDTLHNTIKSEQMLILYFKNLLFLFPVDFKLQKSS